ncbi:glycosyltransferase family 1 protein [Methylophaga lonarensis]|uniref:glycosyltransferase family 1 protein n=1 Tax=Methylophaga lonarensis TaxID=999151 RepID=UPI001F28E52C|nr:glycosyltransferase family 1 protein [Methylophaga lonarensis]
MDKSPRKILKKLSRIDRQFKNNNILSFNNDYNFQKKSIVFLLPYQKMPAGGVIVSHHHSDTINSLFSGEFVSEVFYPENVTCTVDNFKHNSRFKRNNRLNKNRDFVILPEMMAARYAKVLIENQVRFGIHVQNGYSIGLELSSDLASFSDLKDVYLKSDIIIGNSEDTIQNILTVFPDVGEKIIRSYFVINKAKYQEVNDKKNIITYMPRKLSKHSQLVLLFLGDKLPEHWTIKAIDGVTEQEVYDIFYESKIFMSFSEFEGLAMPPAMAAMSGNYVIGYTGEANKEYFHLPCFEEIPCGDIKTFVQSLLASVARFDSGLVQIDHSSIEYLKDLFSQHRQQQFIQDLVRKVDQIMSEA